ncbi:MAG: hypothetical protein K6F03_09820 [Saccharofermentans sp.]|nr:hypothetical protein [Saccharofermentans sp.]
MGKKIIGFLLTFIICIGALPMTSLADSAKPKINRGLYVNKGLNSTFSIQFSDREDITMAVLFLIGEEVKSETETSFDTAVIEGKTYRLYAMQSIKLDNAKVSAGKWEVKNSRFEEIEKAPATGASAGFVLGTACDGDDNLTFSDIVRFKVPKDKTIKLTLKTVNVKKSAKKLVLSATLKQSGKALKGKKLTFTFKGKKYKAKTNKKGVAKVTLKKSVLKKLKVGKNITYKVSYGKIAISKKVKVKK